ncbi:class I SAM-dependent methyltransferase [Sphingorhabdus arenilitoris]|uniref:Class I SAM-dependent methyltransferase n=1 Tax=Sphingorhabdus arenilitoris TaxID=1490041 RepID=A0ABV8RGN2_9SPHN
MNAPDQIQSRPQNAMADPSGKGGGLLTRLLAGRLHKLLDLIDSGLDSGSVEGELPDGSYRVLGGRSPGPRAHMNINSWRALSRIAANGSIGLYEGWQKGEWDSPDPVQIFALFVQNRVTLGDAVRPSPIVGAAGRLWHWLRRNTKAGSRRNIEFHYDLGNAFYATWLDETMTYSSALFGGAETESQSLADAQRAKNDAMLRRLQLSDGDRLLEIGCGWGGLAEQALLQNKLNYQGITLSHEQKAYADHRLSRFGDAAQVSITDYRDVTGTFDAIASVEMVEAVGQQYWPSYLDCIANRLKQGGRAAIQYIRIEDDIFESYAKNMDFIQRYIFPGGMLLSESRFRALAQQRGLDWQDQCDFGLDYAETLRRWRLAFEAAAADGRLPAGFDAQFVKLWRFYLIYCEGGFRGGGINVAQVTLVKQ